MRHILSNILVSSLLFILNSTSYAASENESVTGLIFQDQQGQQISAPLLSSHVEMNVNGLINRVTVKQVFKNESDQWINARYLFPLPDKSAVDHLRLKIGERVIEGEIKPKEQAKRIYQKALNSGKKATLLSQQRSNIFTTQVANIAPFETVIIEIEYQESILYRDGYFSLHYPMTITPRYAPPIKEIEVQQDYLIYADNPHYSEEAQFQHSQEHTNTTDTEAERAIGSMAIDEWINAIESDQLAQQTQQAIKTKATPDLLMTIAVYITSPIKLKKVTSLYHTISHTSLDNQQDLISLTEPVKANQDFVLNWTVNSEAKNNSVFYQENKGNKRYGQLMVLPALSNNQEEKFDSVFDKEMLFVIDTSGSMSGTSMAQAKAALQYGIEQLNPQDTFNIIDFNNEAKLFSSQFMTANQTNKQLANLYISQLNSGGGTNMEDALSLALSSHPKGEKRIQQVIFITDASISNEAMLLTKIHKELKDQRLFMVGIGSAPNRYFMTRSAELGKGTYTYIGKIEEVQQKVSTLFNKITSPVLQDISLTWQDGSTVEYWPKAMGDLYQSEPIQVVMEIPDQQRDASLIISGYQLKNGKKASWSQTLKTHQKTDANSQGISQLLAREKIANISLDQNIKEQDKKTLITALGMTHHMVTQYTSLVAVDKTPARPMHLDSQDKQVKSMLPKGSQQRLPQTGTASDGLIKQGLFMLLFALFILVIKQTNSRYSLRKVSQ